MGKSRMYDLWSRYFLGIAVGAFLQYQFPGLFWLSVIGGVLVSLILLVIGAIKEVDEDEKKA